MSAMSELDTAIRDIAERDYRTDPVQARDRADIIAAVNVPTTETYTMLGGQIITAYFYYRDRAERDRFGGEV